MGDKIKKNKEKIRFLQICYNYLCFEAGNVISISSYSDMKISHNQMIEAEMVAIEKITFNTQKFYLKELNKKSSDPNLLPKINK